MEKVIIINEDSHGFIGIAKDIESAFHFLLQDSWITECTEFPINYDDDSAFLSLEELRVRHGFETLLETLVFMHEQSDCWFEAMFYFDKEEVYDKKNY
jgi:hypothetical protein